MSKKTRFLSMALSMGLALSAFAGGAVAEGDANFNATGMPIVNEKVVQKVVFSSDPVYTTDLGPEMYFFKEMEERTNVNFEFEKLSPDQWNERKNLMFAANELPDILMGGLSNSDIITYSQAGQLLPIKWNGKFQTSLPGSLIGQIGKEPSPDRL